MELPSLELVKKAMAPTIWDFGNEVLYELCKDNFWHTDDKKITAKVWLIGRAYAAAIERRKSKDTDDNDQFYENRVISCFKNSLLDCNLKFLRKEKEITENNMIKILETHHQLITDIKNITSLKKRSLSSKYLHFHLPNLFFIYDTRVVNGLRRFYKKVPKEFSFLLKDENIDKNYSIFFIKCFDLKNRIREKYNILLTNRQLDNLLIK